MAYRLNLAKKAPRTTRKALSERLAKAVGRAGRPDSDEALHDARTDLKKSRSLLRLLRPGVEPQSYADEMSALREIGRALSAARDADVLPATLARLRQRWPDVVPQPVYVSLEARLNDHAQGADAGDVLAGQVGALREAQRRVEAWDLRLDWDDVLDAFTGTFRRGRTAMRRAQREPTDENLHEWRKRVKDHYYHLRLLEAAWPGVLDAYAAESHRLADLLGDDHDLAVLAAVLREGLPPGADDPTQEEPLVPLVTVAEGRRLDLQGEAWQLGERLYGEPPSALRRRIGRLVAAARSQGDRATHDDRLAV
jgi:CHAD domain-containing protein